ncbi:hypothetical protein [Deinococcus roseus]|uniref:Uncharacterized protein n=1 Tax=Deinococcus roseus TaxID=392414 RepID=A0ABQ2D603_9DEIO|nr:hypothetical protein [Deinococcus roseus]GGJ47427.1 hypothetical protein GCM10008938_36800 [Deinococcus roseus]
MTTQLGEDRKDALCYQLQETHLLLQLGSTPTDHKHLLQALHRAHQHLLPLSPALALRLSPLPAQLSEADLNILQLHRTEALDCVEGALWLLENQSGPDVPALVQQMGVQGMADLMADAWSLLCGSGP